MVLKVTGFDALQWSECDASFGLRNEVSLLECKNLRNAQIFWLRQIALVGQPARLIGVAIAENIRVFATARFCSMQNFKRLIHSKL